MQRHSYININGFKARDYELKRWITKQSAANPLLTLHLSEPLLQNSTDHTLPPQGYLLSVPGVPNPDPINIHLQTRTCYIQEHHQYTVEEYQPPATHCGQSWLVTSDASNSVLMHTCAAYVPHEKSKTPDSYVVSYYKALTTSVQSILNANEHHRVAIFIDANCPIPAIGKQSASKRNWEALQTFLQNTGLVVRSLALSTHAPAASPAPNLTSY